MLSNIPEVKVGIVAVSRDCFPKTLSKSRLDNIMTELKDENIYASESIVENECDVMKVLSELKSNEVNALVIFLGNFGPESPETLLAEKFDGPVMFAAAAEENIGVLATDRGDAYCGMLNACYNLGLRGIRVYLPPEPVGTAQEVAAEVRRFIPIARAVIGLKELKVITFGPRPQDFFACNAPIAPLYKLGISVEENSEMDLLIAYEKHENDPRIPDILADLGDQLGKGNKMPDLLGQLAQLELTLLDWMEEHKGASKYVAFANKCWPGFQTKFKFVPCYVNGRLAMRGIPVACEVDIYGAVSQYIATCITGESSLLLDINNTVPDDIYETEEVNTKYGLDQKELFMGFHCGNGAPDRLINPEMKYQLIMHREDAKNGKPCLCRGTLEGTAKPGNMTMLRIQSTADADLQAYVAEGSVFPVCPHSFGTIGVMGVKGLPRFYRNVLLANRFPHHTVIAYGNIGFETFEVMRLLGIDSLFHNRMERPLYKDENPFA